MGHQSCETRFLSRGWVGLSLLSMHWRQAKPDPLQQYYNKVDQMTPLELDQEYTELIHTMSPRERADYADRMQFYQREGRVAEQQRRVLKYYAAMGAISSAWNDLKETVKAFHNLPSPTATSYQTDVGVVDSSTPTPHGKHHSNPRE
jgi:hypothetical protein